MTTFGFIPSIFQTNLLTPFSIVSKTSVDASWTNVFVLTLEKPEIADDSESEDRLDWSKVGTTNLGPTHYTLRVEQNIYVKQ